MNYIVNINELYLISAMRLLCVIMLIHTSNDDAKMKL